ncbi:hypothetical protein C1S86_25825 [Vibrio parahaemolyticus]|nr:hypothetical protein [Vibrio vulnificus]OOQ68313.1 hypothetical protein BSR61_20020 [Vibrio parahaemolyticus]EIJ0957434.1 hypothetical protein [Vibrio vulnificus]EIJ0961794.1 hypothetical protein [Vibrio vulnificus]EIJ0989630.1 hypothetical protein [Vibrio vulnificus]
MLVYPFTVGDWAYVHSVWFTWQSLNTGVLAFVASIFALNAVRYSEEKKRQRNFIASKAFLPQALSELSSYCNACAPLVIEAWRRTQDRTDRCNTPLISKLPKLPDSYQQVFKECISEATPEVAEHLAYILVRLQIHHSRTESLVEEFLPESKITPVSISLMTQVFALAELQSLMSQLFDYARGTKGFDNSPLSASSFFSFYRLWNIEIEENEDLKGFTERNHGKRWNT